MCTLCVVFRRLAPAGAAHLQYILHRPLQPLVRGVPGRQGAALDHPVCSAVKSLHRGKTLRHHHGGKQPVGAGALPPPGKRAGHKTALPVRGVCQRPSERTVNPVGAPNEEAEIAAGKLFHERSAAGTKKFRRAWDSLPAIAARKGKTVLDIFFIMAYTSSAMIGGKGASWSNLWRYRHCPPCF